MATGRAYTQAEYQRVTALRSAIAVLSMESGSDVTVVSSALVSFLIDIFIGLINQNDPNVRGEMKRFSVLLASLADAASQDDLRLIVGSLCDVPGAEQH